uniref:Histone deacetylase glutamine rich N-terminal domain-containing protein n=1 Tax=Timema poppense TaxID=170557 RepID=A0A7R9DBC0_TIMPO|nr:unnamed protein product [Timema poppensis]
MHAFLYFKNRVILLRSCTGTEGEFVIYLMLGRVLMPPESPHFFLLKKQQQLQQQILLQHFQAQQQQLAEQHEQQLRQHLKEETQWKTILGGKKHLIPPNRDLNLGLLVIGTPVYCENIPLDHVATDVGLEAIKDEFWEHQKQLEEQRERREKERLEALKKKDKHEQSAVASTEVKQKLQVHRKH